MQNLKRAVISFVLPIVFLGSSIAFAADIPDEQFVPGSIPTEANNSSKVGIYFEESVDTLRMPSLLYGYKVTSNQFSVLDFCNSTDDVDCSNSTGFKYYALFPPCLTQVDVDCIESVYAIPKGSPARILGTFQRFMPSTVAKPFKSNPELGVPQSGNAGLWTIPGVKHKGGGEDYAVIVSLVGDVNRTHGNINNRDLRVVILPENLVKNPGYKANVAVINEVQQQPGLKQVTITHTGSQNFEPCAIVEDGACALRQGFPENVEFGIGIRFSATLPGWLHGRIANPQINYKIEKYGTYIEMQGQATKVPITGGWATENENNKSIFEQMRKDLWVPLPGSMTMPGASGDKSMKALALWSKLIGDKAIAYPSQWIFYNLPQYQMANADSCIKNSKTLAGFVTTNSTTYAAGPPIFNKETQSLDYEVASPHYLKDGSTFLGEYNLYIDSKVARCIYKFSEAPISATVSVINETGEAKVATTVMTERSGWIHLTAAGFTFSNPTLRVKLTQEVSATPTPSPSTFPSPQKKIAITCVKGKSIKKVTAVKPACPSGWKKK